MEKQARDQFTEEILTEALRRMGADASSARQLDGFESFIYEFTRAGMPCILRITHSSHRSWRMIAGEFEWLNYLIKHGLSVAKPVQSLAGRDVEVIGMSGDAGSQPTQLNPGSSYWTATVFERAPGGPPVKSDWTDDLIRSIGALTGRMHALTKDFTPSRPEYRRETWRRQYGASEPGLPQSEAGVLAKYSDLRAYLDRLPQDRDSYGLIHSDFHRMNFFVDDGKITLFDFDDSCYAWFVYDIAMSLFYVLPHDCVQEEDLNLGRHFLSTYMQGYFRENYLDLRWLLEIPHFLKLREIELYLAILKSEDIENLGSWGRSYMKDRRLKIENDVPYADLGFEALVRSLGGRCLQGDPVILPP